MRLMLCLLTLFALGACATPKSLEKAPKPVGDFRLGFAVSVASPNLTKGPVSREATPEEWSAAMKSAFEARFQRFEGDVFYHIATVVEGYVLAQPGVPVVMSPQSVLIFNVIVIEDATQTTLTEEPHQITVLEQRSANTFIGSGLTQSKEVQLENLSFSAALAVEKWMRMQPWFFDPPPPEAQVTADDDEVPTDPADQADTAG